MATGQATHEHLLTLARQVDAAARDHDVQRLRSVMWRLYDRLVEHLDGETSAVSKMPPADGRLLRRGQRRILGTASALLRNVELPARECDCQSLGELLVAELSLQSEDERRCLPASESDARGCRAHRGDRWSGLGPAA